MFFTQSVPLRSLRLSLPQLASPDMLTIKTVIFFGSFIGNSETYLHWMVKIDQIYQTKPMKGHCFAVFTLLALLAIQTSSEIIVIEPDCPPVLSPPKTVGKVDLDKYIGTWYELSNIPLAFDRGCSKTTAVYSYNDDGTIKVNNTCEVEGQSINIIGKAYPSPDDTEKANSKLKVQFPGPLPIGDYWIVRLADDYSYAVVGSPDYTSLYILSREKTVPDTLYNSIVDDLKKDNFPVEKLVKTVQ